MKSFPGSVSSRRSSERYGNITTAAITISVFLSLPGRSVAQQCTGVSVGRAAAIGGAFVAAEAAAFAIRGDDWWASSPRQSFHFVSGGSASRQQDALLHSAIGYQASRAAAVAWDWACFSPGTSAWLGALTGLAIGLPKEIGDGFHNGFSVDDMMATALGAALPALHRTVPASDIVRLKVFYWPSGEYRNRIPGGLPQLENDYAGQRYFLSINPGRTSPDGPWPRWLGLAFGHSVSTWASAPPVDEWYAAIDLDLGGIPVPFRWWRTFAAFADQVHLPGPGIRISNGDLELGFF